MLVYTVVYVIAMVHSCICKRCGAGLHCGVAGLASLCYHYWRNVRRYGCQPAGDACWQPLNSRWRYSGELETVTSVNCHDLYWPICYVGPFFLLLLCWRYYVMQYNFYLPTWPSCIASTSVVLLWFHYQHCYCVTSLLYVNCQICKPLFYKGIDIHYYSVSLKTNNMLYGNR